MNSEDDSHVAGAAPIAVPYSELSSEVLRGVLEAFVLREGTDYGEREFSLEQKVLDVLQQLERGEARIIFDPVSQSVDILTARRARSE